MAKYAFASRAQTDLSAIARFTKRKWGVAQAERYLAQLERNLELFAAGPQLGRPAGTKYWPMVRKFESGSHVVFYEPTGEGILIGRILHKSMLPTKHGL